MMASWFIVAALSYYPSGHTPGRSEGASSLLEYLKNDNRYNFFLLEDLNERFINFHRDRNRRPLSLSDLISDVHAGTPLALGSIRFLTTGGNQLHLPRQRASDTHPGIHQGDRNDPGIKLVRNVVN